MKKKEKKEKVEKKNKKELKEKLIDIVPILGILLIVFFIAAMVSNEKNINKTMKIHDVTYNEYLDKIEEDSYNIFVIGRTDCSHCIDYKPLVNKVANEYDLDIWYINVDNLEFDEYVKLHDNVGVLKDQFDDEGNPGIPTPATVIYQNGKEVDSILGDVGEEGFLNLLVKNGVV